MSDFLLELRSEEIPARMQAGARADLEKLLRKELSAAGVNPGAITVWSTPRRLALIARDLPDATEPVREETKGPRASAPPQALEGFLRKTGLTQDQLVERDGVLFAVVERPGRAVRDVLAEAIPAVLRAFPWPKSMRWGAPSLSTESTRWVRPLSGIVAILGEDLVACEAGGVSSGFVTLGHRFHHPDEITIGGAQDYQEKLRACHVIVDHKEREAIIRNGAAEAAAAAGLTLMEDEGLVIENAGLTEWPVPLLGRFDPEFLEVPPEVIQLTARTNQKYFVCARDGKLANAFICTANIAASDGGVAIVDGNRKVLAARLSDARFFWEQDRKTTLAEQANKLARITFHEKLGTVADKVDRVATLARWLVERGIVADADPDQAELAARLCKADLVTEMVGEFPELQGLMGGYYARAEGLPDAVADAIRDHYKPVGQGDTVPTAPLTVAVSLADKLDTLVSFFAINEKPTGSKDPFALRRAALAVLSLIQTNGLRTGLSAIWAQGLASSADPVAAQAVSQELVGFFADRLKVQQKEAGVRHDLIDAVFALGGEDDLVRLLARVTALQAFVGTEDGTNLLAGYKRAANILKKEDWHGIEGEIARTGEEDPLAGVDDPELASVIAAKMADRHAQDLSYTAEPAERALLDVLASAEPRADAAIATEDFGGAMAALATLRGPIDRFFEDVTVNDADPAKRAARLELLARFRAAVHKVADFSRIEG
ncbi:glycine--tRNA ligase subunit beta [Altererythrobacter xixiisoli]|uniref:Glycine--tRNA ligase beta subunit n=1 Tax=Croceibacterium xixiisoli TaxID=1476466 RepID=A0A6I4TUQ5_9SPHN|nr:glycine--tRNA ligase subunit beta [Croceibacterium xixiisoli]MXO99975.1 glycine--tRNA ligase subunit beta [Croceibacterium xixiisoli]